MKANVISISEIDMINGNDRNIDTESISNNILLVQIFKHMQQLNYTAIVQSLSNLIMRNLKVLHFSFLENVPFFAYKKLAPFKWPKF